MKAPNTTVISTESALTSGLTPFLADRTQGSSGVMALEYVAQSCLAELRRCTTPSALATAVISRGAEDHAAFHANVRAAGVDNHVRHVRKLSQDAGDDVHGNLDLLYIDGTHRYAPALSDMRQWGSRVVIGGTMFVHDAFCSIGVTRAIARELLFSHTFSYRGRVGSLAEYRREPVEGKRRVRNISRQLVEGPWFARGLLVKLLITLKLRPLTRLLGNRLPWPY